MKNITSFIAVFLMCFGVTVQAQTIQSIGTNVTDPATELSEGCYVLLKNVATQLYAYEDVDDLNHVKLGDSAIVNAGKEYLWKVSYSKGKINFVSTTNRFFPRPKQQKDMLSTFDKNGGLFELQPVANTTYWQLFASWKYGKKTHSGYMSQLDNQFACTEQADANCQYEVIPVTVNKSDEQIAVEALVEAWKGKDKYAGGLTNKDLAKLSKCLTMAEARAVLAAASRVPLDVMEYFHIVNAKTGAALSVVNGNLHAADQSIYDAGQYWKLALSSTGKYTLKHVGSNRFLQVPGTNQPGTEEVVFDVASLDTAQWSLSSGGKFLSLTADSAFVEAGTAKDEGAQWYLIHKRDFRFVLTPVLNEAGDTIESIGSVYLPFNATCGNPDAGIEYYGVNAYGKDFVNVKLTDGIYAGKGVILHCMGNQVDFGFKIGNVAHNVDDQSWNILQGTGTGCPQSSGVYVLEKGEQGTGFYPAAASIPANAVLLQLPEDISANYLKLIMNSDITGIESMETENENAVFYDLSGRRVAHPVHGVYINNGKKVFVK